MGSNLFVVGLNLIHERQWCLNTQITMKDEVLGCAMAWTWYDSKELREGDCEVKKLGKEEEHQRFAEVS